MTVKMHVALMSFSTPVFPNERIEGVLNGAKDWFRYAPNIYFIRSELEYDAWYRRIRAVIAPTDNIVVTTIDPVERVGWVSPATIAWMEKTGVEFPLGE